MNWFLYSIVKFLSTFYSLQQLTGVIKRISNFQHCISSHKCTITRLIFHIELWPSKCFHFTEGCKKVETWRFVLFLNCIIFYFLYFLLVIAMYVLCTNILWMNDFNCIIIGMGFRNRFCVFLVIICKCKCKLMISLRHFHITQS